MKAVIYQHGVLVEGGAERITLEECRYFEELGIETTLLTFYFNPDIYNGRYKIRSRNIHPKRRSTILPIWIFLKILALRKAIIEIKPDIIICVGEEGCAYLFLSTLGMTVPYSAHIYQTIFWDVHQGDTWDNDNRFILARYSYIFRHVYSQIRNSVTGHKQSLPIEPPTLGIRKRIIAELVSLLLLFGVRRARSIFVHSQQMAWEIERLYEKRAIPLKGAFPAEILNYIHKNDVKSILGIPEKIILFSLCRLAPKKRVDLIIKAYKLIAGKNAGVALIIGGTGSELENLKTLAGSLGISDSVIFTGFIKEAHLLDYYACCDIFISADHADFDISPYVALGLRKKVVWSVENEIDVELKNSGFIFPAEPSPEDFARAIDDALRTSAVQEADMKRYSWENYFAAVHRYSAPDVKFRDAGCSEPHAKSRT